MRKNLLLTVLFLFSFSAMAGAYAGDTHYYLRFGTALLVGFDSERSSVAWLRDISSQSDES